MIMTIALLPLLVSIAGLLIYAFTAEKNPKAANAGLVAFGAGLLAFMMISGPTLLAIRVMN